MFLLFQLIFLLSYSYISIQLFCCCKIVKAISHYDSVRFSHSYRFRICFCRFANSWELAALSFDCRRHFKQAYTSFCFFFIAQTIPPLFAISLVLTCLKIHGGIVLSLILQAVKCHPPSSAKQLIANPSVTYAAKFRFSNIAFYMNMIYIKIFRKKLNIYIDSQTKAQCMLSTSLQTCHLLTDCKQVFYSRMILYWKHFLYHLFKWECGYYSLLKNGMYY